MQDSETIEIPISKLKMVLMLLGCLAFVTAGVFFVTSPDRFLSPVARTTEKIFIGGCLGIVFFGFVGFSLFKRILDTSPGLIISEAGITDNSSGVPGGFIPWSDIVAVKETTVASQRFINLEVKNHEDYVKRQKNAFKKWIMRKNFKTYRTGIGIYPNALKTNFDDLKEIIEMRLSEYNSKTKLNEIREKTTY